MVRSTRSTYAAMFGAAVVVGAWELVVTRLASVLYFVDLAHLALAVAVLALGGGGLLARRWLESPRRDAVFVRLLLALPTVIAVASWLLRLSDVAWGAGLFAAPFAVFGAASAIAYRRLRADGPQHLYATEIGGFLVGLLALGPTVLPLLPAPVLGDVGIRTHLRDLVEREGLREHRASTDAYARTDFVRTDEPSVAYVFTDGMFVTRMVAWDGVSPRFADERVQRLTPLKRLPYRLGRKERVLLLGAGAGFDAAVGLQEGAEHIDAVEVNAATIDLARERDTWAGGVLGSPRVTTHVAEARRYVAATTERYDQVNLTLMQTSPASGRGRSAVDGRTLTVQALQRYIGLLRLGGWLAIVQNTKPFADRTYIGLAAALSGLGLPTANHVRRVEAPHADTRDNPFSHLLLVSKTPVTPRQDDELAGFVAARPDFALVPFAAVPRDQVADAATDDRPFLFRGGRMPIHVPFAVGLAIVALALLVRRGGRRGGRPFVLRIIAIGAAAMASMLVQVVVVYRAQAAIGLPTQAMATALSGLLGGAAVGAIAALRFTRITARAAGLAALVAAVALAVVLDVAVDALVGLSIRDAAIAFGVIVALCSVPLGLPYVVAMRDVEGGHSVSEGDVIGADGIGGVLGAAGATAIAMQLGFVAVSACAVVGFAAFAWLGGRSET